MWKSKTERDQWKMEPLSSNLDLPYIDPLCQIMIMSDVDYRIRLSRDLCQMLQILEGVSLLCFGTEWYIVNDPAGYAAVKNRDNNVGLMVDRPEIGLAIYQDYKCVEVRPLFGIERSNHLLKNRPMYKIFKINE